MKIRPCYTSTGKRIRLNQAILRVRHERLVAYIAVGELRSPSGTPREAA